MGGNNRPACRESEWIAGAACNKIEGMIHDTANSIHFLENIVSEHRAIDNVERYKLHFFGQLNSFVGRKM